MSNGWFWLWIQPKAVSRQRQLSSVFLKKSERVGSTYTVLESARFTHGKLSSQGKRIAVNGSSPITYVWVVSYG